MGFQGIRLLLGLNQSQLAEHLAVSLTIGLSTWK